jgi:hypothetical protein
MIGRQISEFIRKDVSIRNVGNNEETQALAHPV